MASIYPTQEQLLQWRHGWQDEQPSIGRHEYLARKAAEHAARVCAEACNENGRSDGHTCAEEILALIEQGKEGGV